MSAGDRPGADPLAALTAAGLPDHLLCASDLTCLGLAGLGKRETLTLGRVDLGGQARLGARQIGVVQVADRDPPWL